VADGEKSIPEALDEMQRKVNNQDKDSEDAWEKY